MSDCTIPSISLAGIFGKLRTKRPLTQSEADRLTDSDIPSPRRCAAAVALSCRDDLRAYEDAVLSKIGKDFWHVIGACGFEVCPSSEGNDAPAARLPGHWRHALRQVCERQPLGDPVLSRLLCDITSSNSFDDLAAGLLMAICIYGLQDADTESLTQRMAASGQLFDYRKEPSLSGARLIRRYPTGALSEKTALILPALIASVRSFVNVCSPFLVAKSLGFTGGTWDKLSVIPGFAFPQPGDESISALRECGVAMTVTTGSANPADRKLYQLRSATGTIESKPLIVSSIASKHLTFPVHRLLLDVRVGEGAFLNTAEEGEDVGGTISRILNSSGIKCTYTLTQTLQPTGCAIGNALEVAEAISVMSESKGTWDVRGLQEQRLLVVDFFAKLMGAEYPQKTPSEWARIATEKLDSGEVLNAFRRILRTHGVSDEIVAALIENPLTALRLDTSPAYVFSRNGGVLRRIDQVRVGELVNRDMGGGGNTFEGVFSGTSGIVLHRRIGDVIRSGDVICAIYGAGDRAKELIEKASSYFEFTRL